MQDAADQGRNGAEVRVAAAAQAEDLAADSILLVGKGEGRKSGGLEQVRRCRGEVEALMADKELNILEGKGSRIGRGDGVLSRAEKEEEAEADHVCRGNFKRGSGCKGNCEDVPEHLNGYRLDAMGWRVLFVVGAPHADKAVVLLKIWT